VRYASFVRKDDAFLCDECGHRLVATASAGCGECGAPRGGRRFAQLPPARIEALARGMRFLRFSRIAAIAVLVGFVAMLVALPLRVLTESLAPSVLTTAGDFVGEGVFFLGMAAALAGLPASPVLACVGLVRVRHATKDDAAARGNAAGADLEVSDAAHDAVRFAIAVTVVVVTLELWNPEGTPRTVALGVAAVVSLALAVQLWMLARLRALCERRMSGARNAAWPAPAACLMCALGVAALPGGRGDTMLPALLLPGIFLIGNAVELVRFSAIEAHLRALVAALSPCGRGDPS